jgi:hypothetical protein
MPKKVKNTKMKKTSKRSDMEKKVMGQVMSGKLKAKPKWYFVIGSALMSAGLVLATISAVFLTNLTIFLVNKRGPGYGRTAILLESFPLWVPVLAVAGIILGIFLLRKYDFSYKKNFPAIVILFVVSIIIAGLLVDKTGLNDVWSKRGPMRGFYRRLEMQSGSDSENSIPGNQGRVKGIMKGRRNF